MARTEKVIMTNMCMVFSENRILVQDKTDDDYSGITFREDMWKEENHLQML